jgi:hypothetical protein
MNHTPLDIATLSTAAQRALGPGPGRTMASRGMLPLPPLDQLCVLYQLALDGDLVLASSARATAANLPDTLLAGTLVDPKLDPRVLDLFASLAGTKPAVFDALAMNATTADDTMVVLAERGGARECDLIATNEQRLLRHPAIISALYMNKQARMSTVDRAVELAVRNNVRVPGLAAWDDIARALQGAPPIDAAAEAAYAKAAAEPDDDAAADADSDKPDAPAKKDNDDPGEDVPWNELPMRVKVRLAMSGSRRRRNEALRDPKSSIATIAIKSPMRFKDSDIEKIAGQQTASEDVIRIVAQNPEYTKSYQVKLALCRNPKTPIGNAANLLMHLYERDLNAIAMSRNVPQATVANARRLLMQRRGQKPGAKK